MAAGGGIILHIDVNSAFLSWSALRLLESGSQVDLRTIPSIVGGDQKTRHGIVVAKSIPAKKYGIHTADTVASAFLKCPTLVSVKPDHAYYKKKSNELMDYLRTFCSRIQQASIDECYLDYEAIRGEYKSPEEAARIICDSVRETLGFTVNVGISDRKVLAKMASDFEKPDKVHTLYAGEIRDKLWPLPIGRLHMCGSKTAEKMEQLGIRTIGDLAVADRDQIFSLFKRHGNLLWSYANGIDTSRVETGGREAKSIGNSTTLAKDVLTRDQAAPVLERLAGSVADRLHKKGFRAGQVSVEIKYATFQSVSHQMTPDVPIFDKDTLLKAALGLFDELWDGSPIRLLGIRTAKFRKENEPYQMNLFEYQKEREAREKQAARDQKNRKLKEAISRIEKKYGSGTVTKGPKE